MHTGAAAVAGASGGRAVADSTQILTLSTMSMRATARSYGMEVMRRQTLRRAARARTDCEGCSSPPVRHAGLTTAEKGGAGLAGARTAISAECLRDRCW
jgi:hypothetical protein